MPVHLALLFNKSLERNVLTHEKQELFESRVRLLSYEVLKLLNLEHIAGTLRPPLHGMTSDVNIILKFNGFVNTYCIFVTATQEGTVSIHDDQRKRGWLLKQHTEDVLVTLSVLHILDNASKKVPHCITVYASFLCANKGPSK